MTPDRNNLLAAWSISRNPLLEGPAAFREGSSSPRELPLKALFFPSHSSPQHSLPREKKVRVVIAWRSRALLLKQALSSKPKRSAFGKTWL